MIYNSQGNALTIAYGVSGNGLQLAYNLNGNVVWQSDYEWENENQSDTKAWYISQIGYDTDKPKKATFTNGIRGTEFTLKKASDDSVVYTGEIKNQMADFSDFTTTGVYYLSCDGINSYTFTIADNRIWNVAALPSLKFMEMARSDTFDVGYAPSSFAFRDSANYSFELNGLVMQYMSNPSYYESLPWNVYKASECEYAELRVQDCPNIIWLMKFAVMRYYDMNVNDSKKLDAFLKGQLAYFLYLYPSIMQYIDSNWYETIRDWAISIWSVSGSDTSWNTSLSDNNLFSVQSTINTTDTKGSCPPGGFVVPNFMMYEVCTRDGLNSANDFLTSAINNLNWLVNDVDLTLPVNTKGQRMSEYIPFHALTYAYEMYPTHCPNNTYSKITEVANVLISRSYNIWDYTQYQTAGDLSGATTTIWNNNQSQTSGLANNPGYVGMMGVYYALARVITDTTIKARLKELAFSHMAHGFGRNPLGRCFDYKATEDFDGAKLGWVSRLSGGYGHLDNVIGVLDGSPKNPSFPYDPSGSTGYTEGWIAFNSAWNMALAYLNGENASITDGIGIFA